MSRTQPSSSAQNTEVYPDYPLQFLSQPAFGVSLLDEVVLTGQQNQHHLASTAGTDLKDTSQAPMSVLPVQPKPLRRFNHMQSKTHAGQLQQSSQRKSCVSLNYKLPTVKRAKRGQVCPHCRVKRVKVRKARVKVRHSKAHRLELVST